MGKGLSLWFACSSILILTAASIAISFNVWVALLLGAVCIMNIGWGFILKARLRRKQEALNVSIPSEPAENPSVL